MKSKKVVVVTEVGNSNQMEKKGFVDSLANVEANGTKVDIISNDRHPQIKKKMRLNHGTINHQFDPRGVAGEVVISYTPCYQQTRVAREQALPQMRS